MEYLRYKGYTGSVETGNEHCFGKVQGLPGTEIWYESNAKAGIETEFKKAVDQYLDDCTRRGVPPAKPCSGKYNIRMSSELHARVTNLAHKMGWSVNTCINYI